MEMYKMYEHLETENWHYVEEARSFVSKTLSNGKENEVFRYLQRSYFFGFIEVIWLPGNSLQAIDLKCHFSNIAKMKKWKLLFFFARDMRNFDISRHACYLNNNFKNFRNLNQEFSVVLSKNEGFSNVNSFKKRWQRTLKKSINKCKDYTIEICTNSEDVISLYQELKAIKKLSKREVLMDKYIKNIFKLFSDKLLVLKISDCDGICVSVRGVLLNGNYAFDIFAATGSKGRSVGASYVLMFELLKKLDEIDTIELFDLNGIDPEKNKGVFDFKDGLGGSIVFRQGNYSWSNSKLGNIIITLVGRYL